MKPSPVWLMRQAGRYLPEYKAVREKSGSFWTMCMSPELAVDVTLQPIRRFDFDAAILFSDILVVPYAMGQTVRFEEGIGPVLGPFADVVWDRDEARWQDRLSPVYTAMAEARRQLASEKAMIGFAGAPWTLAAYMLGGRGSPDQRAAKCHAYAEPDRFTALLEALADAVAFHLGCQIEAGADVVQIFDSWAGGLPEQAFWDWCIVPARRIVSALRVRYPNARIIGFPRAATQDGYAAYVRETGVDAISLDTAAPMSWAAKTLGGSVALQGNLDPVVLVAGGAALDRAVDAIMAATVDVPLIFNLGHGVLPETPLEHIARLIARVRGESAP